jgi:hypothetical protein
LISRRHTGGRNRTHGLDKLSERPRARRSCTAFVEPAAVLELAVGVVTEEVRRTDRPIRPRGCLGLVVKIGERETASHDNEAPGSDGNGGNVATSGNVAMAAGGDSEPVTPATRGNDATT